MSSGIRAALTVLPMLGLLTTACAAHKRHKPVPLPAPPPRAVVGPFLLPAQVRVVAFHRLPEQFNTPIPPVWQADGQALSLLQITPAGAKVARFGGASLREEKPFDLSMQSGSKDQPSPLSQLDFAIDLQGARLAVVANDASDNSVKVFVRPLEPDAKVDLVATFPGQVESAAISWLSPDDLLLGLSATRPTDSAAASAEFAGIYRLSTKVHGDNSQFVLDCTRPINPTRFVLSPHGRALVNSSRGTAVYLLDFERFACRRVALPSFARMQVLGWDGDDSRILYASVLSARFSDELAVFELEFGNNQRRRIGAPMANAAYTKSGKIVIPGSQRLSPALLRAKPDMLVPVQLGVFDKAASEITIYPLGLWTGAAMMAQARLAYSAAADAAAVDVAVPVGNQITQELVEFSLASRHAESITTARVNQRLVYSWSPSGSRLAICDCASEQGNLLVVEPPLK
jgi:hypothetical protein